MSVSGSGGVSAMSGGNVDLQAILSGGDAFMARLKLFDERAATARESAALAQALLAEAKRAQAVADQTQARADVLIAENRAKAEELEMAITAAKQARAELDGRLAPLLAFLRD